MQEKITKIMEYVCDDLCRHPRENPDQEALVVICAECELEQIIEMVLETIKQFREENEIGGFKSLTEEESQEQMKLDPEWNRKHKKQIERAKNDRENHVKSKHEPYRIPLLWIRDKGSGGTHLYGTDSHDSLHVSDDGINYYNLQNGDGTGKGGGYEFVDHDTEGMMYNQILHYYLENGKIG